LELVVRKLVQARLVTMATHLQLVERIYLSRLLVAVAVVVAVAVFVVVETVARAVARALYLAVLQVQVYQVKVTMVGRFMTRAVAVLRLLAVAEKQRSGRKVSLLAETFSVVMAAMAHYMTAFTMQEVAVHQCKTHHKALLTVRAVKAVAVMVASTRQTLHQRQAQRTEVAVAVAV
jgi:hypothetical protein